MVSDPTGCVCVCVCVCVCTGVCAQSCPTLCDPIDCSPPGSSVHRILQARILEWVALPSPGDLPDPGVEPTSPALHVDSLPLRHLESRPQAMFCSHISHVFTYRLISFTWERRGHKFSNRMHWTYPRIPKKAEKGFELKPLTQNLTMKWMWPILSRVRLL